MNIKLENQITYKESFDDENEIIKYGQSIIQNSDQFEISIIKEINLDNQNKNISIFGLFDGHNGSEVSKYLSLHFSQFLLENNNYINGNYEKSLIETFKNLDDSFRSLQVQLELQKYSIKQEQNINKNNDKDFFDDFLEIFNPRNLEGVNIAEFCGSCGLVILITEKKVFIANAGNSKCIPVNNKNEIILDKINREHTIKDEYEIDRLNKIFGYNNSDNEENNKDKFLNEFPLLVTRGFGDLCHKDNKLINLEDQYISIIPDIIEIPIENLKYLIIGNNDCFSDDNNKLSLEKYFLNKYEENNKQKNISKIIEDFLEEKLSEIKNKKEIDINKLSGIVVEFKNEKNIDNINNIIQDEANDTNENSNKKNKSDDEGEE